MLKYCLPWNTMKLDGTQLLAHNCNINLYFRIFSEIRTRLLRIIHRPCCEQFHVGIIFFLPNYTHQLYDCTGGSVLLLTG